MGEGGCVKGYVRIGKFNPAFRVRDLGERGGCAG